METERTSSLVRWALLGIVLLFTGVILFSHHVTTTRENQVGTPLPTKYSNYVYKVSLEYPADWQPNLEPDGYNYYKYNGADGFFSLSATTSSGVSINTLANKQKGQYGASPVISSRSIDGQDARLITPSVSSGASNDQAELIVQYPKSVVISGQSYNYLIIQADVGHVETIADSIRFIK